MEKNISVFLSISLSFLVFILEGTALAQPSNEQIKVFRSAKTVRIVVKQSYDDPGVRRCIEKAARKAAEYASLKVVACKANDCDLTFKIESKVSPLSAYYSGVGRSYSGASLSGLISLETQSVFLSSSF